jgi:hypothetical protein
VDFQSDGTHPNVTGQTRVASKLMEFFGRGCDKCLSFLQTTFVEGLSSALEAASRLQAWSGSHATYFQQEPLWDQHVEEHTVGFTSNLGKVDFCRR